MVYIPKYSSLSVVATKQLLLYVHIQRYIAQPESCCCVKRLWCERDGIIHRFYLLSPLWHVQPAVQCICYMDGVCSVWKKKKIKHTILCSVCFDVVLRCSCDSVCDGVGAHMILLTVCAYSGHCTDARFDCIGGLSAVLYCCFAKTVRILNTLLRRIQLKHTKHVRSCRFGAFRENWVCFLRFVDPLHVSRSLSFHSLARSFLHPIQRLPLSSRLFSAFDSRVLCISLGCSALRLISIPNRCSSFRSPFSLYAKNFECI